MKYSLYSLTRKSVFFCYRKTKPSGEISIKTDAEIQTELHPIESYIDPTYKWNTWDYKHEAIKMVSLMQCFSIYGAQPTAGSQSRA